MRKAILDSQNKVIDIRSEYNGVQTAIEITEEQVQEFLVHMNNNCFVFYNTSTNSFSFKKNIFKLKEELRKKRNKDLVESDVWVMNDIWDKWTTEQKNVISIYRQELRDYINLIKTESDIETIQYPVKPEFVTL